MNDLILVETYQCGYNDGKSNIYPHPPSKRDDPTSFYEYQRGYFDGQCAYKLIKEKENKETLGSLGIK